MSVMKTRPSIPDQTAHLAVLVCALLLAAPAARAQFACDACAESYDRYGSAVARGDFNGDGYEDLAVGLPEEDISNWPGDAIAEAGAVEVIYGTPSGLDTPNRQFWHQNSSGVRDVAAPGDSFGSSLAAGDFNGDGYDDLAVGVRYEDVGSIVDAGAVNVVYGSTAGLSATAPDDQFWHQNSSGVRDAAEAGDDFGWSLAAGDFNGDGYDDLAIGVAYEDFVYGDVGAVNVVYGSSAGLSATAPDDQFLRGFDDLYPHYGWALAAGDFNGDGYDDLASGLPHAYYEEGSVVVTRGSSAGFDGWFSFWYQSGDQREWYDHFGWALAAGDFNGDGYDDLAIGVPHEDLGYGDAGAVNVAYGPSNHPEQQFWHQDVANVEDVAEYYDNFGWALAAGDFNGDGYDDLAIGVPNEDIFAYDGLIADAGAVNVLHGAFLIGLSATFVPDQIWTQITIQPPPPLP
jgi:FG-GAP repeat protein